MVTIRSVVETINETIYYRNPGIRIKGQGARRGSRPRKKFGSGAKAN
jgi:hypothetical protein